MEIILHDMQGYLFLNTSVMKQIYSVFIIMIFSIGTILNSCKTTTTSQSLREAAFEWEKSMQQRDVELITAAFDTSMVAIYHSHQAIYGKVANAVLWQSQFNDSLDQHPIYVESVDVSKSGEMGYVYGKWWSIHPVEKYYNGGRFVSVWKRINDKWQIVILSVNVQEDVKSERLSNY